MQNMFISQFYQNLLARTENRDTPEAFLQHWRQIFSSALTGFSPFIVPVIDELVVSMPYSRENLLAGLQTMFSGFASSSFIALPEKMKQNPPQIAIIAAGNIPGVAIAPALQLAAIGCPVIVKLARQDQSLLPFLVKKFETTFGASGISCGYWSHGSPALHDLLEAADKIVAFGNDETLAALRQKYPDKIIGFGHKFSVGIAAKPHISDGELELFALDTVLFQQTGCLSPQAFFVSGSWKTAGSFAERYFHFLEKMLVRFSVPRLSPQEIYQRRILLDELDLGAEFYFAEMTNSSIVIVSEELQLQRLLGAHVVQIIPFASQNVLQAQLQKIQAWLQGCSLSCEQSGRRKFQQILCTSGCTFVAQPGRLQAPPLLWKNGGLSLIDNLLQKK